MNNIDNPLSEYQPPSKEALRNFGIDISRETVEKYALEKFGRLPQSHIEMNFGQAIEALKNSKKVARKGWNGKGMFVYYVPAGNFKSYTEIGKSIADKDDLVHYNPYFAIKNVNDTVSTWVPSVNDCLAEDWYVVE